jgi:hypothetical protein
MNDELCSLENGERAVDAGEEWRAAESSAVEDGGDEWKRLQRGQAATARASAGDVRKE